MGLLTPDERHTLLNALLNLPFTDHELGRRALLGGLPTGLTNSIRFAGARDTDLAIIVDTADDCAPPPGESWPVILLISNALLSAESTFHEGVLRTLLVALEARIVNRPAELMPALVLSFGNPFERRIRPAELVGRDRELQRMAEKLQNNNHCCIVGPPGSGKTLLLEAALERFPAHMGWQPGEVLSIDFRDITKLDGLQEEIVQRLGGKRASEWRSLLRSHPIHLIALDNLGHMPRGDRGLEVRRWLRARADDGVQLLITSNESLSRLFRHDDPTIDSPFDGLDPRPVELAPMPPTVCRQAIEHRLVGTPFRIDDFAQILDRPHQPRELLRLCAVRYEELTRST